MKAKRIVIFGANSGIAEAVARRYAQGGSEFYLLGRDTQMLSEMCKDLQIRGANKAHFSQWDARTFSEHPRSVDRAFAEMTSVDLVLVAHGSLSDQKACEADYQKALVEFEINCLSVISILTHIANKMETQKSGTIAVISSVAGDRGRPSNYIYGTAKAAVTAFASGLRSRLFASGVHVVTIKPGFVKTAMTAHLRQGPLWASPDCVACGIVRAIECKRDEVYLPRFWYFIMLIIRNIPNAIFKRLKL